MYTTCSVGAAAGCHADRQKVCLVQGSSEIHLTSAGGSGGGISTGTGTAATDAVAAAAAKAVAEAKQQQQQSAKSDVGAVAGSDAKQLFYNEKGEVMGEVRPLSKLHLCTVSQIIGIPCLVPLNNIFCS